MGDLGKAYYNLGTELFEVGYYEQAVKYFIQAYELGYERELVFENLYACFILPNEQEFRNNYNKNSEDVTQMPFEECTLDFIPVSENRFYIFDKLQQEFLGVFELEKEPIQGEVEEFDSILYADIWDIREMLPNLKERNWGTVYVLLNDLESKFVSFLKLPRFKELYLGNVAVFKDTDIMCAVFEQFEEIYLPKKVVAEEPGKYLKLINEFHANRIGNLGKSRDNIFLSICIPSYNRGTIALKNVQRLVQCAYDSEIEIIISNNGSTEDVEGYREIQKIADTRIRYHEFEENQGFATNLLKTLELARGKYAVLASDEDMIILERMGEYLSCLKANPTCGVFWTKGLGGGFTKIPKDEVYKAGIGAISMVSNLNYMTGITFNLQIFKDARALDIISNMRGNVFLEYYVHIPLAIIVAKYAKFYNMSIMLWDSRETVKAEDRLLKYMLPESRIAQQNAIMDFMHKGACVQGKEFLELFYQKVRKTYFLLDLAYRVKYEKYKELYAWEEICLMVYNANIEYSETFPIGLSSEGREQMKNNLQEIFFNYLDSQNVLLKYPKEERPERIILHQKIRLALQKHEKDIEDVENLIKQYLVSANDNVVGKTNAEVQIVDTFLKSTEG